MSGNLKRYFNLFALDGLPSRSFPGIKDAGYHGVQFASPASPRDLHECRAAGLEVAASGRIDRPEETNPQAERWAADGFVCATLHAGSGLEDNDAAARLIESVLNAASNFNISLYIETHRATIFQDIWRTVQFVRQFPEIRINADFSHWYTGQEMVYGGFDRKLEFIRPVLERVRFIHGRIGNPGCIQVRIDPEDKPEPEYIGHFRQLWTACFRCGATIFTPELLSAKIYYARAFPDSNGALVEESDRWQQSLLLARIAEECFAGAQGNV